MIAPRPCWGGNDPILDRLEAVQIHMENFVVANDVPFGENGKPTLRKASRLDVELLVCLDILDELSKELMPCGITCVTTD